MIHTTINLSVPYAEKINNNGFQPTVTTYILDNYPQIDPSRKRPLILICPGGGYQHLSPREAEPIAIQMNAMGFHACVLRYSIVDNPEVPMCFPSSFLDACQAIALIRSRAEEWNVDPDKIVVAGFSAGGHLAATVGVHWKNQMVQEYLHLKSEQVKPNALLLCYPVITAGEFAHRGSIQNVLGTSTVSPDFVSLEKQVSSDVPPTFMWHTYSDETVPVENSLLFANELRKNKIPLELHIFAKGLHGLALASQETAPDNYPAIIQPECQIWVNLFGTWLKALYK
jgi:acetyl esterase/lipase